MFHMEKRSRNTLIIMMMMMMMMMIMMMMMMMMKLLMYILSVKLSVQILDPPDLGTLQT